MITIVANRERALQVGAKAMAERFPNLTYEDWDRAWKDYDLRAFCDGDVGIGVLLTNGPEIHLAIVPEYRNRWISRRIIHAMFDRPLAEYGFLETQVMAGNDKGDDFVQRLGFKVVRREPEQTLYRKVA